MELALPPVLGRATRGVASLERALGVLAASDAGAIEPAARARIAGNAKLALGRYWLANGEANRGRSLLLAAAAEDAQGALARAASASSG
jgi:hypothetical protein